MCDYSLYEFPNRLAREGENLVLCRFPTGTTGFTTLLDFERKQAWNIGEWKIAGGVGAWLVAACRRWIAREQCPQMTAVCLPPGAKLLFTDIPLRLQKALNVRSVELVTFTQLSCEAYTYRDAVRFSDGTAILLIRLSEPMRAKVLSLGGGGAEFIPAGTQSPILGYQVA